MSPAAAPSDSHAAGAVDRLFTAAMTERGALHTLVIAHRDPSLHAAAARHSEAGLGFVTGELPGHLRYKRASRRRPIELEEPRWNDVDADVVVLEPEPNYWTTNRMLRSVCAVRLPELILIVLPEGKHLAGRDAYPPGSAVPASRRREARIGHIDIEAGNEPVDGSWHYAVERGGRENGVAAAVDDFVASRPGEWHVSGEDGLLWLVGAGARPALTRTAPSARSADSTTGGRASDGSEPVEDGPSGAGAVIGGPGATRIKPARSLSAGDRASAAAESVARTRVDDGDALHTIVAPSGDSNGSGPSPAVPDKAGLRETSDVLDDRTGDSTRTPLPAVPNGPDYQALFADKAQKLKAASVELQSLKEQRHRLRGQVQRLERRLDEMREAQRTLRDQLSASASTVQDHELKLQAAILWQARLRDEGDRLRDALREMRGDLQAAQADVERGRRSQATLRSLAFDGDSSADG